MTLPLAIDRANILSKSKKETPASLLFYFYYISITSARLSSPRLTICSDTLSSWSVPTRRT